MTNTNCLDGIRCPRCGQAEHFHVEARVTCLVTDDGAEPRGDTDWDGDSQCSCPECGHGGPLSTFRLVLPPDPDERNDDRAEWAGYALAAFQSQTGCAREDAVGDLLCDLNHWCERSGVSFADALGRAEWHYRVETSGGGV